MEQREQKSGLVLKYGKRRFDGGNEIELIRTIERQKTLKQLQELQKDNLNEVQLEIAAKKELQETHQNPIVEALPQAAPEAAAAPVLKNRVWEAVLMGPLALCIGTVGMLTAGLAIVTFKQMKNEAMLQQSHLVLADCWKTFKKGMVDSVTTPVRVYKAATVKV